MSVHRANLFSQKLQSHSCPDPSKPVQEPPCSSSIALPHARAPPILTLPRLLSLNPLSLTSLSPRFSRPPPSKPPPLLLSHPEIPPSFHLFEPSNPSKKMLLKTISHFSISLPCPTPGCPLFTLHSEVTQRLHRLLPEIA